MPVILDNPLDRLYKLLGDLTGRVSTNERKIATLTSLNAASGSKAVLAVFSDGKVGLRVYGPTGTLVQDLTA